MRSNLSILRLQPAHNRTILSAEPDFSSCAQQSQHPEAPACTQPSFSGCPDRFLHLCAGILASWGSRLHTTALFRSSPTRGMITYCFCIQFSLMISFYDVRYYSMAIISDTYFVRYLNDHIISERISVRFPLKYLIPDIFMLNYCPEYWSFLNVGKKCCPIYWIWRYNGHLCFAVCRLPHKITTFLHAVFPYSGRILVFCRKRGMLWNMKAKLPVTLRQIIYARSCCGGYE